MGSIGRINNRYLMPPNIVLHPNSSASSGDLGRFEKGLNVSNGLQVAVGQPRVEFITGTAGIGHEETFSLDGNRVLNVRLSPHCCRLLAS